MTLDHNATVSIIIPLYNRETLILDTIDSALNQKTTANIEIVVIDDGSTDGGFEVVDACREKHPNIKLIRQKNQGVSAARNHGVAVATGEFIQFLDSDDLFDPRKIETQLHALVAAPGADFCTCNSVFLRADNSTTPGFIVGDDVLSGDFLSKALRSNPWHLHSPLYRRRAIERIGPWDEGLRCLEDWEYCCRAALANCTFVHVPEGLAIVRQHDGERLSSAPVEIVSEHLRLVFGKILKELETLDATDECYDQVARHLFSAGRGYVDCGRIGDATDCFRAARAASRSRKLKRRLRALSALSSLLGHRRFVRWTRAVNALVSGR